MRRPISVDGREYRVYMGGLHGQWQALDEVDRVVATGRSRRELVAGIRARNDEGPPPKQGAHI